GIGKQAYWDSLVAGKSGVDWITEFDTDPYPCKVAAKVRDFNASDFISAKQIRHMGRFSQFAVAACRMAVDDSHLALAPFVTTNAMVCFGTSGGAPIFEQAAVNFQLGGMRSVDPWTALEYPPHAPASYVSIELGITGPTVSVSSNCCTGLDALQSAALQVRSGRSKIVITGSSEAPISPALFATFSALGALSKRSDDPTRASRPYDLLRDGLVIGEGAAGFVLEELEHARDRGAPVYAEIRGFGGASEAIDMRKGDLTGKVMARAINGAIQDSGLRPEDIDHVNAHGSSLPDFDVCDSNAFKEALGQHAYRIPISSIKSMIGQPFAAAGSLQAAAACMSILNQKVPPTLNQEVPDPRCDLDYVPNASRIVRVKNVLANGHGFGGGCSALVLGRVDE
ncbi:MAG TPA: beta-ketoacyl synthase N-terminal-like domain-containing protein, partial [Methylomirabilota bacterium]|nr:beta-ketoacyl synthase N-terminal-like domain-containing protein [Methylomirabilota bacterium]